MKTVLKKRLDWNKVIFMFIWVPVAVYLLINLAIALVTEIARA